MDAWRWMGAVELGAAIGRGDIDPVALTETYLAAIEAHPRGRDIYARTTPDRARREARAAAERVRAGRRCSPLDGVPISWKDVFDTAGIATEAGSALLKGRVPARDARILGRATAAGLVCLGKTHTTELAFSGLGLNPITATPPNVHDPARLSGGSSAGAAASVAHGLAAAGIGSDTAGSVRLPAAWNDLAGYKTSRGWLSLAGVVPLCPSFDTVGPLTRSVADASALTAALAGAPAPDLRGTSLAGRRFLVAEGLPFEGAEEDVHAGMERAVAALERAGARVTRVALDLGPVIELATALFSPEAYGTWRDRIEADPEAMYGPVLDRFRGGAKISAADHVAAWSALRELRAAYLSRTAGTDAVLMPTCAIGPPRRAGVEADAVVFAERNLMALRNTRLASLLDLCALTLPTGVPCAGLSLLAPAGHERRLLRIGAAAEAAVTSRDGVR